MNEYEAFRTSYGWMISNGRLEFGPYSSEEKAQDSAQTLNLAAQERRSFDAGRQADRPALRA